MSKHGDALRRSGYTVRRVVANILATWDAATDAQREQGAQWYPDAGVAARDLATAHGTTVERVAAIIAHTSPQLQWGRNLLAASVFVATGGDRLPGLLGASPRAALGAWEASEPLATLNGPKVRRFAANILGDYEPVTVDVHAARVALKGCPNPQTVLERVGVYDAIEHCYRLAARRVGVTPATMQATTWIVQRGRHN